MFMLLLSLSCCIVLLYFLHVQSCKENLDFAHKTNSFGYETKKYSFIHIPKTSGSSFSTFIRNYPEHFTVENHHVVATEKNNPVIIIREPYDRFCSMYYYWRDDNVDKHNTTIKEFINYIKKNDKILITGRTEEYHFFPQSYYLQPNVYKHAIVIRYDKNNEIMNERVNEMIDYLEIPQKNIKLTEVNISQNKNEIFLDENDKLDIKEIYHDDFILWNVVNKSPFVFLKVF